MKLGTVLFTSTQIQKRISRLAEQISNDYLNREILAISVLKGSFIFFADLIRQLNNVEVEIDFIGGSSYIDTKTTGKIDIYLDIRKEIKGKNILLVDDIVDTGISINYIKERIFALSPLTLKTCSLLNKQSRRQADVKIDYLGFDIEDLFVVGYGLDYNDKFRNLPYISILKE